MPELRNLNAKRHQVDYVNYQTDWDKKEEGEGTLCLSIKETNAAQF